MSNTNKQANTNNLRWTPPNIVQKQQQESYYGSYNHRNCQNNFPTNSYTTPPSSTKYHHYNSQSQPTTPHRNPSTSKHE